jgi:2-hydroxycyclohexanecarboxyl-CoA dehydrogenase
VIALTTAAADAETVALGRALRDLDEVALVAPERPPDLDETIAFVPADLGSPDDTEAALASVDRIGPLTCVVAAPATAPAAGIATVTEDVWASTMASNQTAAMHTARSSGRLLSKRGAGRIVLVGWRIDRSGARTVHLAAMSGAIGQLARSLAAEVGPSNVTVNGILVPPERLVDAAGAVRLLVLPDAGYLTGEVLAPGALDGGPGSAGLPSSSLKDRVALITGAGQGIGAAIADRFAAVSAVVAVNSLHPEKAEATADRLRGRGARAEAFPADVGQPQEVQGLVESVEASFGPIEVLVNNAAVLSMERLVDLDLADWHRQIAVDLTGPFRLCRGVLPSMIEAGWGRIVNVSSIWGLVAARGATAYSAAKGGLIELTRALAEEVGPDGVRVCAIAPGTVSTPQLAADAAFAGISVPEMEERYARDTVLGRIGTPDEIAGLVAFLASEAGAPFQGQTVAVTGGRSE